MFRFWLSVVVLHLPLWAEPGYRLCKLPPMFSNNKSLFMRNFMLRRWLPFKHSGGNLGASHKLWFWDFMRCLESVFEPFTDSNLFFYEVGCTVKNKILYICVYVIIYTYSKCLVLFDGIGNEFRIQWGPGFNFGFIVIVLGQ